MLIGEHCSVLTYLKVIYKIYKHYFWPRMFLFHLLIFSIWLLRLSCSQQGAVVNSATAERRRSVNTSRCVSCCRPCTTYKSKYNSLNLQGYFTNERHTYIAEIILKLNSTLISHKLRLRWGLYQQVVSAFFTLLYPPGLRESQPPVLQRLRGVTFTLLFSGVAKRWLLGRSAAVRLLHFCTCFQDNWHFKGRLWILTACPWQALCLHLKTVWLNMWLLRFFPLKLSKKPVTLRGSRWMLQRRKQRCELFLLVGHIKQSVLISCI